METKWTDSQLEAINSRGKNILVSAAAGSGKTAVLVERIISLMIEERVRVEDLLIVTFTNAAAGEMKERIQKKLQEKRRDLVSDKSGIDKRDLISFLTRQIQNIPGASISTLHSFCIDVLRDNFQMAGIDPSFKLVNDSLGAILSANAIGLVLEERYAKAETGFLNLVEAYGGNKTDDKLVETIKSIDKFIQAKPNQEEWLRDQAEFYKKIKSFTDKEDLIAYVLASRAGDIFIRDIGESLAASIEALEEAKEIAMAYENPMPSLENLEDDLRQLGAIKTSLEETRSAEGLKGMEGVKFTRYKSPGKKDKDQYDEGDLNQVKAQRDYVKKSYQKMAKKAENIFSASFLEDMKYIGRPVEELVDLVLDYKKQYYSLKQDNTVLDFSDLEHLTLKVLENDDVKRGLQDKFKYIFFDEYQDTNLVQETIINKVKRDNNLFFVGDVKQSIYRFRLADPTIFNKKYASYRDSGDSQKIDLSKNFRSRREILDFCNLVFENIMSEAYGEVDYTNKDHQLYPGGESVPFDNNIELVIIEKGKTKKSLQSSGDEEAPEDDGYIDSDEGGEEEDPEGISLQAMYTAGKIKDLVKAGLEYKDIAILMRSPKGKTRIFEDTLSACGIPCYIDYKTSNFDAIEIKCLLDYLKVIDNQNQDEALIGVMSSVFGNFDNEELIQIREAFPDYEFYEAVRAYRNLDNQVARKLDDFYERLSEDIRREQMMGLDDFLWTMVEKRAYAMYIGSLDNGEQRLHNIKSFIGKAREYEASESRGLFGFLRHIDHLLKEKVEDSDSPTILESENVVSLMSIHKSKGLEFKAVFVCNIEKNINEMDLRQNIILHNELGLGLKYINPELGIKDDNIIRDIIKGQKQRETISEEIRVLYVALTRAIDRLYLVGSVADVEKFASKISKGSIKNNIASHKSFLAWIGNVLIREEKGLALRQYTQISAEMNDPRAKYEIVILGQEDVNQIYKQDQTGKNEIKTLAQEAENIQKDGVLESKIQKYLSFSYPYLEETKTRSKISVTELTRGYENREPSGEVDYAALKRPLFVKDHSLFKAHEIGTIIHFLMENIPVKTYTQPELEAHIEKMVDLELLTREEAGVIPRERIISFFDSQLGQRMIKSNELRREASFLMKKEGCLIEGIIDCYFEEDDGIVLLDYKTDALIDKSRHEDQLGLYKEALEAMKGKPVKEAYIYWIAHDSFSKI